jgi:hypothetical protein
MCNWGAQIAYVVHWVELTDDISLQVVLSSDVP